MRAPFVFAPLIALVLCGLASACGLWDLYGLQQLGGLLLAIGAVFEILRKQAFEAADDWLIGLGMLGSCWCAFAWAVAAPAEGVDAGLWWISGTCVLWLCQWTYATTDDATKEILIGRMGAVAVVCLAVTTLIECWIHGGIRFRQVGWWGFGNSNSVMALCFPPIAAWCVVAIFAPRGRRLAASIPWLGLALCVFIAVATGRRSALIAGTAGVLAVAVASLPSRRLRAWILPACVSGFLIAPLLVACGALPTSGDIPRDLMLRAGWAEWIEHPWLGIGVQGSVALATGSSEAARLMSATGLWTHHSHNQLLEWLLRGGFIGGSIQLLIWGLAAWRIARLENTGFRIGLAVLLAMHVAYASLDPTQAELSGLILSGLILALCSTISHPGHRAWTRRSVVCVPVVFAGALIAFVANRMAFSALMVQGMPPATLARAAEKSVDPIVTAHVLEALATDLLQPNGGQPVFLLAAGDSIRHNTGSAGPFLPTLRSAAAGNLNFRTYLSSLEELCVRQPMTDTHYRQIDRLFGGRPPLSIPESIRRRITWLRSDSPPPQSLPMPVGIDEAADAVMVGIAVQFRLDDFLQPEIPIRMMMDKYGAIPIAAQWCAACIIRTSTMEISSLPRANARMRWAFQQGQPSIVLWARNDAELRRANGLIDMWSLASP